MGPVNEGLQFPPQALEDTPEGITLRKQFAVDLVKDFGTFNRVPVFKFHSFIHSLHYVLFVSASSFKN
jgi:hypothetical protein